MWGGRKAFSGSQYFYSTPLEVKSLWMRCLCLWLCQSLFASSSSLPLGGSWWASKQFPLRSLVFRCLAGWLPSRSLAVLQFTQTPTPHLSIDHGFKTTKTNKANHPYLSNVFQFGVSRCLLLYDGDGWRWRWRFHGDHSSYLFHRTRIRSNKSSWALSTLWLFQMFSTR